MYVEGYLSKYEINTMVQPAFKKFKYESIQCELKFRYQVCALLR